MEKYLNQFHQPSAKFVEVTKPHLYRTLGKYHVPTHQSWEWWKLCQVYFIRASVILRNNFQNSRFLHEVIDLTESSLVLFICIKLLATCTDDNLVESKSLYNNSPG